MPDSKDNDTRQIGKGPTQTPKTPNEPNSSSAEDNAVARTLAKRFIQRRDDFALQGYNGAYAPARRAITLADVQAHIEGRKTIGHYLVDSNGKCRVACLDIDWDKSITVDGQEVEPRAIFSTDHALQPRLVESIRSLADGLATRVQNFWPESTVMVTFSGSKGLHVYACAPKQVLASDARSLISTAMDSLSSFKPSRGSNFYRSEFHPGLTVEVFPKQDSVGKGGYGNLLRLPLGINQKTGRRGFFYDLGAPIHELRPLSPEVVLTRGSIPKEKRR